MSGSIDNLFGNVSTLENADSAVSKLFSAENNRPVDRLILNKKQRTVLNDVNEQEETPVPHQTPQEPIETNTPEETIFPQDTETVSTTERPHPQARVIDTKEVELEKASRTLFVGNITTDVITSKQTYKEFKALFSGEAPLRVESIRFRSISFDEPLPRKVAFVKQKLHSLRDAVNAYVVFSNSSGTQLQHLVSRLNGTVFKNRHLRVDSVTHPAPHSNTRSVFIGNLDFEEDEESLWRHFGKCGAIEYVRIVRDSKTNIGKGFAYVQFKELESVSKALLLNGKVMVSVHANDHKGGNSSKRWSRELRVTRCRNVRKKDIKGSNRGTKLRTKTGNKGLANLNETQKTRIGRANKVLGKADRATLGRELTIEGMRASKSDNVANVLKGKHKKPRWKTGRVTKRSQAYKKAHSSK